MRFSDETLMAYVDDQLDTQTRASVEAAMATDPDLARRIEGYRALDGKLRSAFDPVVQEPVPERLLAAARATPAERQGNNVIPLRRKVARKEWPRWPALAASLLIGVIVGQLLLRARGTSSFEVNGGQILASGQLDQALSHRLASENDHAAPVQLGVSFRQKGGSYCRAFTLHETSVLAGLACRAHGAWQVQVLAQTETASTTGYRPAASGMPREVLEAINDRMSGDPLDAGAESAARAKDWN